MEDSPQRRFATQRVRHTNVTENLSVSVGQMFATVPMWKIRHATVIGWGRRGWVERVGVRGVEVGGWGFEVGGGVREVNWGRGVKNPQPQSPNPPPRPQPQPPRPNALTLTTQLPDSNLSPLCGESSTSALMQTFVRRLRSNSRSHLLWN